MAGEPTEAELVNLTTMDLVADWCQLEGDAGDPLTARGSLFIMVGTTGAKHPRILGMIEKASFVAATAPWQVIITPAVKGGAAAVTRGPTLLETGAAVLLGKICRLTAGEEVLVVSKAKAVQDAADQALALAKATSAPPKAAADVFKLDLVVNQGIEKELQIMDAAPLETCYKNYETVFGCYPEPKKEANAMQLTGLKYLVDNKLVPYIDLGVWGPFAGRMFKKLKFRGLVQTKAGEFHQVEIGGPPSMEIWQDHWEVAITACISLKVVTLGTLQRYAELISSFHRRFGEGAWAVIYQADVRMRSEHFERIRRRGTKEKADAVAAGGRHPFDENSPWQWVFEQAIGDLPFWKEQVEDVGTQVSFKAGSLGKALGGDAPLANGRSGNRDAERVLVDPNAAGGGGKSFQQIRDLPPAGPPPKKLKQQAGEAQTRLGLRKFLNLAKFRRCQNPVMVQFLTLILLLKIQSHILVIICTWESQGHLCLI